jgi:hypothetical protein
LKLNSKERGMPDEVPAPAFCLTPGGGKKFSVSGRKSGRERNNLAIIEAGKAIQKQVPT